MTRARMMFRRARHAVGAVPTNSVAPAFSGSAMVGATLTASTGTWTGSPTGYVYQHQQSDDGSTGWADISGATSQTFSPGAGLKAKYARPGVRASNAYGSALAYAYGAAVGPIADAPLVPTIAPTSQWTGTAGSGFGTANPSAPSDPTRTGAKTILRQLFVPQIAFTADETLVVTAAAFGGMTKVTAWCEGNSVDLTSEGVFDYVDANGVTRWVRGYGVKLDYAAAMALSTTGAMRVYFQGIPANGGVQERVIGPFLFYPRAPGVGAGKQYDYEVQVIPGSSAVAGVSYPTIVAALNYMQSVSAVFPHVVLASNGRYSTAGTVSPARNAATSFATIEAAPGVTAYLGDYDVAYTMLGYDGLRFKGAGVVLETSAMSRDLTWALRYHAASNQWLWLDGCELTAGTPSPTYAGSGSGAQSLRYGTLPTQYFFSSQNTFGPFNFYFTEVNAHDLSGYGIQHAELIRNSVLDTVSGSGCELNQGAIHGLQLTKCDGVQTGFRVDTPAFTIRYTGSASVAQIDQVRQDNSSTVSANGRACYFRLYEDSGTPTHTITVTNTGTSYTTVQALVDAINALTGWVATMADPAPILNASFLSVPGSAPSLGIVKRTVTSTPQSLITIADVHANALTMDGTTGTTFENTTLEFISAYGLVESASVAINTVKDLSMRNCYFQDVSVTSGYTNQVSIVTGPMSHILIDSTTITGANNVLQVGASGVAATFDAYSQLSRLSLEGLTRVNTTDPDLVMDSIAVRTLTVPSGATNSKALSSAAEATLYTDAATVPPDLTPLSPLQLVDGSWPGRYLPDGSEQLAA